ncbi:MAG TPA: hypothetical protein VF223_27235 [Trebonia sp.]
MMQPRPQARPAAIMRVTVAVVVTMAVVMAVAVLVVRAIRGIHDVQNALINALPHIDKYQGHALAN